MLATPMLARSEAIPRPEGIQQDVNFWIRVYTEVNTNEGFLHDERNLGVVYDTLKFSAGSSPRDRQRMVDERRDGHISTAGASSQRCQANRRAKRYRPTTNACSRCGVRTRARSPSGMRRRASDFSSARRTGSAKA